jgi:AraC family transcriptional regulator
MRARTDFRSTAYRLMVKIMAPSSVKVDFAQERELAYQRVFERLPQLSSIAVNWQGLYIAYDEFLPGQTPNVFAQQHGLGIFIDLPNPVLAERTIAEQRREEVVRQGDIVIVPAQTWQQADWNAAGGAILVGLEPAALTQVMIETVDRANIELLPHFATADPLLEQLGRALKRALLENAARLYAEALLTALIVRLGQDYSAQKPYLSTYRGGLPKPKLEAVLSYIHAHLDCDLSLRELATVAQLGSHYFWQLFKQSIGLTPYQYVIRCRVERAKVLIKQGMPLAEVARTVGFVDQSHLHRHFQRLVGLTPRAFRNQVK